VLGPIFAACGLFLLSTLHSGSSQMTTISYLVLTGLGLGFVMANYLVAGLNDVDHKDNGIATSTQTLFKKIGETLGVTMLGVIINRRMTEELPKNLSSRAIASLPSTDVNTLGAILMSPLSQTMPASVVNGIRTSLGNSIEYAFLIAAVITIFVFVLSFFIKDKPLKNRDEQMNGTVPRDEKKAKESRTGTDNGDDASNEHSDLEKSKESNGD